MMIGRLFQSRDGCETFLALSPVRYSDWVCQGILLRKRTPSIAELKGLTRRHLMWWREIIGPEEWIS